MTELFFAGGGQKAFRYVTVKIGRVSFTAVNEGKEGVDTSAS